MKFQTTDFFTPTRDFNADDVVFSFERQLKTDNPWNQYVAGAAWEYSAGMGFPELIKIDREGRRPHGEVHAERIRRRRSSPTSRWTSPPSCRRNMPTSCEADGKKDQLNQMPLGTGPFEFVAYQPDAVIRYKRP